MDIGLLLGIIATVKIKICKKIAVGNSSDYPGFFPKSREEFTLVRVRSGRSDPVTVRPGRSDGGRTATPSSSHQFFAEPVLHTINGLVEIDRFLRVIE